MLKRLQGRQLLSLPYSAMSGGEREKTCTSSIDVSSIKELVKRWYPSRPTYKKKAHLALSDIKESINELQYYREKVFLPGVVS